MNQDITYCTSASCMRKTGCRRNLDNYKDVNTQQLSCMSGKECQIYDYTYFLRFRVSDRSPMPVLKASNSRELE